MFDISVLWISPLLFRIWPHLLKNLRTKSASFIEVSHLHRQIDDVGWFPDGSLVVSDGFAAVYVDLSLLCEFGYFFAWMSWLCDFKVQLLAIRTSVPGWCGGDGGGCGLILFYFVFVFVSVKVCFDLGVYCWASIGSLSCSFFCLRGVTS